MPKVLLAVGIVLACLAIPAFSSSYMLRVFNVALITYLCVLSSMCFLECVDRILLLRQDFGELGLILRQMWF